MERKNKSKKTDSIDPFIKRHLLCILTISFAIILFMVAIVLDLTTLTGDPMANPTYSTMMDILAIIIFLSIPILIIDILIARKLKRKPKRPPQALDEGEAPQIGNKIHIIKQKIKNTIIKLSTKFPRLQIIEIAEKTGADQSLIIETVKEMISQKEIYAEYFESSNSVAFDQQANIDEIDSLMDSFREWEEKGKGKME